VRSRSVVAHRIAGLHSGRDAARSSARGAGYRAGEERGEVRAVLRIPGLRDLPSRLAALGVRRVRLERPEEVAPAR
jgi:hypothetical protein